MKRKRISTLLALVLVLSFFVSMPVDATETKSDKTVQELGDMGVENIQDIPKENPSIVNDDMEEKSSDNNFAGEIPPKSITTNVNEKESFSKNLLPKSIDYTREDLGILDSLDISDQFGTHINTNDANLVEGRTYTLLYLWSLDDPAGDYKGKTATFNIPSVFSSATISPSTMPLYYDDNGTKIQIGTITANTGNGTMTIQFNNNSILDNKSNIHGWLSISAQCGSTLGKSDITIGWNGSNEDKISVNVIKDGPGTDKIALLNKYIKSGVNGDQPIVKQDAQGRFYITFSVELFISQSYSQIKLVDTIYSGMEVDPTSIKVISRPMDGQVYTGVYQANYDTWNLNNPTGSQAVKYDATADFKNTNSINFSNTGFEVTFNNIDFNSSLASRQLPTNPIQMRYRVDYNVFLTGVDPSGTLEEAQSSFESQKTKNTASLEFNDSVITQANWIKGIAGGGAEGEVRDVLLTKVDDKTKEKLSGAIFNLYKQNPYNSSLWELYKADINVATGSTLVDGLTFGTYRFEETKAPNGYELPQQPFESFIIDQNTSTSNFEVELSNYKALGDIQFEKVDSVDDTKKLDATFEIRKKADDSLVKTVSTGTDGICLEEGLEIGDYYLVETVAPDNYKLDATHYEFTITKDTINKIFVGDKAIKNTLKLGGVEFEKVDSVDDTKKLDATFEIRKKIDDSLVKTVSTGADGSCLEEGLEVGDYYLVETVAPDNYKLDLTHYDFTITEDTINKIYVGDKAIKNTLKLGGVEFEKVDSVDDTKKLDATFEIRKKMDDSLVKTVSTGTDGICLEEGLEIGDYYLVETVAPDNYKLDSTHYEFTVTEDTINKIYIGNKAIKNEKFSQKDDTGGIRFEKIDSKNSDIKLKATFEIHKKEDNSLVATVTTDAIGIGEANNLKVGDYYLVETVAPSGYKIDETQRNFTITKDNINTVYVGEKAIKNIKNESTSTIKTKPKTGDSNSNLYMFMAFFIMLSSLLVMFVIKRKYLS